MRKRRKVSSGSADSLGDPHSPPLPDTAQWQPRSDAVENLRSAFVQRCRAAENVIALKAANERAMNVDNFDSGLGVEDIIRDEIRGILPRRYAVQPGVISDRTGKTAGDVDIAVFNDLWFPTVKAGATPSSRRVHMPIDGVYAVIEAKQTLDYASFDAGMRKLVSCHRLERPATFANRLVENRDSDHCFHGLTNPLYSALIGTSLVPGLTLEALADRFYNTCRSLKRLEVVRSLCVLGHGTLTWGWWDEHFDARPARFMRDDLFHPVVPVLHKTPPGPPALFSLMADLLLHLFHSVLRAEDLAHAYGPDKLDIKRPTMRNVRLEPDEEWLATLDVEYGEEGDRVENKTGADGRRMSELHKEHVEEIYDTVYGNRLQPTEE
jgi:hypothetical protein